MNRLWVVTELYYPEETSTGYYMTQIAEGLTTDFDVKVLCGQPNYFKRGIRAPWREMHNGVEILRCTGTTLNKDVIAFRIINMLTLGLSAFFRALLSFRKNDIVLVVTTPPSLPFIMALVSNLRGARYVPLIHDNYPELAIAARKLGTNSFISRIIRSANKWLLNGAAKIIVVGRDMKVLVSEKVKKKKTPVAVIPNWAETEDLKPKPRKENDLLQDLALMDRFVVLYAGNMGHPNDVESVVDCAEKLLDDGRFHFIFLGTGAKRKWLESEVETRQLGNITLLAPRPRMEQNAFLNACDIAVISLVKGMWGVSMPSRTYNTLAVGKPIIALAEPGSELAMVVEEDDLGWIVPPEQPELLLKTIFEAYQRWDDFEEFCQRSRNAAIKRYTLKMALDRYRRELGECVR